MYYFDHAATSPMRPEVLAAFTAAAGEFGNASSLHSFGRRARALVEQAREEIALAVDAHPTEVIFTSGATEANNLALKGIFWQRQQFARTSAQQIWVSAVEHPAVLDTARFLTEQGAELKLIPVDKDGRAHLASVLDAANTAPENMSVVSMMWANHEVGTVQPVAELVSGLSPTGVPVHIDAVQALATIDLSFAQSGAHAMSLSAHKIGGPVGVGLLLAQRDLQLTPVLHGGGQERQVRSGTVPVAAIVAAAAAFSAAVAERVAVSVRLAQLQQQLIAGVLNQIPNAILGGAPAGPDRLVSNVHFIFPGTKSESLLFLLDLAGFACSPGSACTAGVVQASEVALAMGYSNDLASATIRFSMGPDTNSEAVAALTSALPKLVAQAQQAYS